MKTNGLSRLTLGYTDANQRHEAALGAVFSVSYDPSHSSAIIWNQDALSSLPPTPISSTKEATSASTPIDNVQSLSPSSKASSVSSTSLSSPTDIRPTADRPLASHTGLIASIALGTLLGALLVAILGILWVRRRRRRRSGSLQPIDTSLRRGAPREEATSVREFDAFTAPTELQTYIGGWEMANNGRLELDT
ncbi:MAG: hypothetical protein Q9222_002589 [Ikaeria aurantiellina]